MYRYTIYLSIYPYLRELGELEDLAVGVEPGHDHLVHPGQHARDVLGRLARADAHFGAEAERMAAEPEEARLERDARAGAGLGEYHGEGLVRKRLVRARLHGLDLLGQLEHLAHLSAAQVVDVQEVALAGGQRRVAVGRAEARRPSPCHRRTSGVRWERHRAHGEGRRRRREENQRHRGREVPN